MTEVTNLRAEIAPWLTGCVIDLGCGRDKVAEHAMGVDFLMHRSGKKGEMRTTIADIPSGWEKFHAFCVQHKAKFDTVFSSHLLENYPRAYPVLGMWLQLVRIGGHLILLLPVEETYRGISKNRHNPAHKSEWTGATDFIERMPEKLAERLHVLYAQDEIGKWSFMVVFRRDK